MNRLFRHKKDGNIFVVLGHVFIENPKTGGMQTGYRFSPLNDTRYEYVREADDFNERYEPYHPPLPTKAPVIVGGKL